jgi:hypothetical protein
LATLGALSGQWEVALVSAMVAATLCSFFLRRIQSAHFSLKANLYSFLGLPVFCWLLFRSGLHHRKGTVTWRGRIHKNAHVICIKESRTSAIERTS